MSSGILAVNSLGLAGLQTAQTGMANVATNVSGAAVEGFHRRQIHPMMISATTNPLVQGGTVIIDSMVRSYSALVSTQYLNNHAKVRQAQSINTAAQIVDRMLVDESAGLTEVFNGFFTTASDLSADPGSGTARTAFATTTVELTDRVRNLAATIEETRRQALFQMTGVINAVNDKTQALAKVNQLIQASSAYGKPLPSADLLDERDRLTGEITDLIGASIETSPLGQTTLRFDGISLVEGVQAARLKPIIDESGLPSGSIDVFLPIGDGERSGGTGRVAVIRGGDLVGGEFGGLKRYADGADAWLERLDALAKSLVAFGDPRPKPVPDSETNNTPDPAAEAGVQWYNKLGEHLGGFDENERFFDGMFRVNPDYDERTGEPRSLRPSLTLQSNLTSGALVPWTTKEGENASSEPAEQGFAIEIASGRSLIMREWSDWVSGVSSGLSKWRAEEASFNAVQYSLNEQREQVSGVDLDEEATDLLRFQQLYQANSSVLQAAARMFDVLLTTTGR